tara:strand:+ start:138 stop:1496 length:1359 start_codon:yes stop_codon:yes gene_type:complete
MNNKQSEPQQREEMIRRLMPLSQGPSIPSVQDYAQDRKRIQNESWPYGSTNETHFGGVQGDPNPATALFPNVDIGLDDVGMVAGSIGQHLLKMAKMPGEALKGNAPSPNDVTDFAVDTFLGGGAFSKAIRAIPPGALGTFGGPKAKTFRDDVNKVAKEMDANGANRDEIWSATREMGQPQYKDIDGKWKFEIDDSAAKIGPGVGQLKAGGMGAVLPLSKMLKHKALYDAYPDLRKIEVRRLPDRGPAGQMAGDIMGLNPDTLARRVGAKSTILHEGQHGVQAREGFAAGGNPGAVENLRPDNPQYKKHMDNIKSVENAMGYYKSGSYQIDLDKSNKWFREKWQPKLTKLEKSFDSGNLGFDEWVEKTTAFQNKMKKEKAAKFPNLEYLERVAKEYGLYTPSRNISARDTYLRLAGEAEARNVQTRMDYTPDQRQSTPPWETLDVPEKELIVK